MSFLISYMANRRTSGNSTQEEEENGTQDRIEELDETQVNMTEDRSVTPDNEDMAKTEQEPIREVVIKRASKTRHTDLLQKALQNHKVRANQIELTNESNSHIFAMAKTLWQKNRKRTAYTTFLCPCTMIQKS